MKPEIHLFPLCLLQVLSKTLIFSEIKQEVQDKLQEIELTHLMSCIKAGLSIHIKNQSNKLALRKKEESKSIIRVMMKHHLQPKKQQHTMAKDQIFEVQVLEKKEIGKVPYLKMGLQMLVKEIDQVNKMLVKKASLVIKMVMLAEEMTMIQLSGLLLDPNQLLILSLFPKIIMLLKNNRKLFMVTKLKVIVVQDFNKLN